MKLLCWGREMRGEGREENKIDDFSISFQHFNAFFLRLQFFPPSRRLINIILMKCYSVNDI